MSVIVSFTTIMMNVTSYFYIAFLAFSCVEPNRDLAKRDRLNYFRHHHAKMIQNPITIGKKHVEENIVLSATVSKAETIRHKICTTKICLECLTFANYRNRVHQQIQIFCTSILTLQSCCPFKYF